MDSSTLPLPVPPAQRAQILDSLRGFALLCILIMNGFSFSMLTYMPIAATEQFVTYPLDIPLMALALILAEGKFYTLFSLLFGIGFSIILIRNQERGLNPNRVFYRRLLILMAFGLAHLLLLWEGDILFLYALTGMLLPLFKNTSNKALLVWAAVLILSPILIDVLRVIYQWSPGSGLLAIAQELDKQNGISSDQLVYPKYLSNPESGYSEILKWCQSGFFYRFQYILDSNRIPKVLGIFLIGYYVGRNQLYLNLKVNRPLFQRIARWGFGIGLPMNIAHAYFFIDGHDVPNSWIGLADTLTYALGVVPLSLAYAAAIALVWPTPKANWLRRLAPVGRMALTNYLMQTVLSLLIFTNLGLALGSKVGYSVVFVFVVAIWAIQILYSTFWFRYFQYGPMEWLWRQLTYGQRLPLHRPTLSKATK
jgi:uncharacterized protein